MKHFRTSYYKKNDPVHGGNRDFILCQAASRYTHPSGMFCYLKHAAVSWLALANMWTSIRLVHPEDDVNHFECLSVKLDNSPHGASLKKNSC